MERNLRKLPKQSQVRAQRGWKLSLVVAAAVVAVSIVVSATVNPLLGRTIHWDWTATAAAIVFVGLAVALRRRWV